MALKSEDRYGSCRALAEDIERWLADEHVAAWCGPWITRSARWGRRHKPAVASVVVLLATAAIRPSGGGPVLINNESDSRRPASATGPSMARSEEPGPIWLRDALGLSYLLLGDPIPAIQQLERTRAIRLSQLGLNHPDTMKAKTRIA